MEFNNIYAVQRVFHRARLRLKKNIKCERYPAFSNVTQTLRRHRHQHAHTYTFIERNERTSNWNNEVMDIFSSFDIFCIEIDLIII